MKGMLERRRDGADEEGTEEGTPPHELERAPAAGRRGGIVGGGRLGGAELRKKLRSRRDGEDEEITQHGRQLRQLQSRGEVLCVGGAQVRSRRDPKEC